MSNFSGGFLRDDATNALVTSSQAPLVQSGGFLRDANGALVVAVGPVSGAPQMQTIREFDLGVFTASQTRDIAVTLPVAYTDNHYSVLATLVDEAGSANSSALRQVQGAKTSSGFTLRVTSGTAVGYSDGQLTADILIIHD